jgi:hypothetical protein
MSTAKFDTLSNLAGTQTVPVATVAQGSAKAWVNFNGTGTVAIRAGFNVSSITDVNTGQYTVNFTNAMVDTNFVTVVTVKSEDNGTIGSNNNSTIAGSAIRTTGGVDVFSSSAAAVRIDSAIINVAIFR